MSNTIDLDIPNSETRVRRCAIRTVLDDLIAHNLTIKDAVRAIENLISVDEVHATGRTRTGNDIGGI